MNGKLLTAIIGLCLLLSCSKSMTGGSTETSSNVSGIIYTASGAPAAGAIVRFYPVSYNPYTRSLGKTKAVGAATTVSSLDSTTTDASGHYNVLLDSGSYNLLASGSGNLAYHDSIVPVKGSTIHPADTLRAPGSIAGVIRMQGSDNPETVFIIFMGTGSVWFPSDTLGDFATGNMAPGNYPVRFLTTTPNYKVLDTNLTIIAGKIDTLAAPIQLQYTGIPVPAGLHIQYDSAREIVTLVWNTPTTGTKVASYNIYREQSDSTNFALIKGGLPAPDTTWQDTTAVQDCTYYYRVAAVDTNQTAGVMCGAVGVKIASYFVVDTVFGSKGNGPGQFNEPVSIAIANNGNIYISDQFNSRIQVFNTNFSFKTQFSSILLKYPANITLDSSNNAYVLGSEGIESLFVFDTTGNLLRSFSVLSWGNIAIIGDELYVLISDSYVSSDSIAEYSPTGVKNRIWFAGNANNCATFASADSNKIIVCNSCLEQVTIFDTLGNILSSINAAPDPTYSAFDKSKGRLYVNCQINSNESVLKAYDSQNNLIAQYKMTGPILTGLAVDPRGTGFIYEVFPDNNEILRLHCLLP